MVHGCWLTDGKPNVMDNGRKSLNMMYGGRCMMGDVWQVMDSGVLMIDYVGRWCMLIYG